MNQFQAEPNAGSDYIANVPSLSIPCRLRLSNFLYRVGMPGKKNERRFQRPSNLSNGECRE